MYDSSSISEESESRASSALLNSQLGGVASVLGDQEEDVGSGTANGNERESRISGVNIPGPVDRLSRVGVRAFPAPPSASARRSRLQRQKGFCDPNCSELPVVTPDKGSLNSAMRKRYLKELFLSNSLNRGFGSILLSARDSVSSSRECDSYLCDAAEENNNRSFWALDPMEHAWMLSVVDGNYDTILDYLSEDFSLLTKRDFVSGFTAIHWLAKYGRDETLIKLLRHAERLGSPVNVNLKASGGFTPLHIAAMHCQYMVVKLLVGAFGADVDAMDYSGRRPWQYLKSSASAEMKELLGAPECEWEIVGHQNVNNNSSCALSHLTAETPENEVHTESTVKTYSRWKFDSLKNFFAPLLHFGSRSLRSSGAAATQLDVQVSP